MHGVTKSVIFAVDGPSVPGKDPWGNTRIGLSATTKINRKDFGLPGMLHWRPAASWWEKRCRSPWTYNSSKPKLL
jgi:hypothetical protein